jgi:glycolate oxidase FAD binding subunit
VSVDTLKVRDAKDVEDVVRAAIASEQPLEIIGHGSKRLIGQPMVTNALLDVSALNAVTSYEPNELIITVQAGAPLADVESLIDSRNQQFAFEPINTAPLLGAPDVGTIGGMIGAGLAGPRRIKAGGVRDHLLGAHGVSGYGDSFKAGGRVVKNVTGYDLCKLLAGSWGTLAVMTEVTIKVLPAPRTELTLMLFGLDDRRAGEAMTLALNAPVELSGAAHLPQAAAARAPLKGEMAVTALRLEGFAASVAARAEHLVWALKGFGRLEQLDGQHSGDFWRQVREVEAFHKDPRPLWRISVPPASGWRVAEAAPGEALYDWGGGLVWLLSQADPRPAARALGGHATLYRGQGPAFEPLDGALAALTARVKAAFDPKNVLNPGRMGS